jgi:hypothetical protein
LRVQSAIERNVYLNLIASESSLGIKEVNDDFSSFMQENQKEKQNEYNQKEAIAIPDAFIRKPISHSERFMSIVEVYPDEMAKSYHTNLANYRFNNTPIDLPLFEGDHKDRAIAIIERELAGLDENQREEILKELHDTIIAQFLEQLRFEYAMKMSEAKRQGNEEEELQYLALLQKIHQQLKI